VLTRYPDAQAEVAAVFRQAGLRAVTEIRGSTETMIDALPAEARPGGRAPLLRLLEAW
jgi:hypothetical protein